MELSSSTKDNTIPAVPLRNKMLDQNQILFSLNLVEMKPMVNL